MTSISGMNQQKKVVCIGAAVVDCIVRGFDPAVIAPTGNVGESAELRPGGEAINQSVALSKLGCAATAVCFTGNDSAGDILLQELKKYQVNPDFIRQPENVKTPVTVMFIDEKGDRRSITNLAHHYNFHPEQDMSYMDGAAAISLCSLFRAPFRDPAVVLAVAKEAADRGIPVFADTKIPNAGPMALADLSASLPYVDTIFPNEKEAAYYSGETEPEAMADVFLRIGVKNVIVKLGENGCLLKNAAETIRLPGLPVAAVDATGAGDNFAAGFIAARLEGADNTEALQFANACGAVSTLSVGATTGVKSREQVLTYLDRLC